MIKGSIDRFEDDFAVIKFDFKMGDLPKKWLPEGSDIGDFILIDGDYIILDKANNYKL